MTRFTLLAVILAGCGTEKPRCQVRFYWGRLALMRHYELAPDDLVTYVKSPDEAIELAHKLNCEVEP